MTVRWLLGLVALLTLAGSAWAAQPRPVVFVSQASPTPEGGTALLTLRLSRPSGKAVRIRYATKDGTAKAGEDYTARSGTLTFKPRTRTTTIRIDVTDDSVAEDDEEFYLRLSQARGARLARREVPVTIEFSDLPGPFTRHATALPGPDGFGSAVGAFTFDPAAAAFTFTITSHGLHEQPRVSHIHTADNVTAEAAIVIFPTPLQEGTVTGTGRANRTWIIGLYEQPETYAFHVHTPSFGQWIDGRFSR